MPEPSAPPRPSPQHPRGGGAETTRLPLSTWYAPVLRATAAAYRKGLGEGRLVSEFMPEVRAAYLAAGGDPEQARTMVPQMIAAVARDHPDWLYGPASARIEREDRFWRARGMWPPPIDRSAWPAIPDEA